MCAHNSSRKFRAVWNLSHSSPMLLVACVLLSCLGVNWSNPEQRCNSRAVQLTREGCVASTSQVRRRDWQESLDDLQECKRFRPRSALLVHARWQCRLPRHQLRGGRPDEHDKRACRLHVKVANMNCGQEGDIYVDVTHNCSVGGLKEAIAAQCNISATQQRLLFMGRELHDEASLLSDHGELLSNYSTLHMTHRPILNRSHEFPEEADRSLTEPGMRADAETIPSIVETLLQMLHTMTSGGMAIGGGAPRSLHSRDGDPQLHSIRFTEFLYSLGSMT